MSKRKETKKTAHFILERDGFSIHTLELSRQITQREYHFLKDALYCQQEQDIKGGWIYPDGYVKHGIRMVTFENNKSDKMDTYFIRVVINPRKLIDPPILIHWYPSAGEIQHQEAQESICRHI